jgi:Tol biopolymer transport system component
MVNLSESFPADMHVLDFKWAPDSSRIAYLIGRKVITDLGPWHLPRVDGFYDLYSCLPDGTDKIKVNGQLPDGGSVLRVFKWSPDSSYIAYFADQEIHNIYGLYISQTNGANNLKISDSVYRYLQYHHVPIFFDFTTEEFAQIIEWAPDSSRIVHVISSNGGDFDLLEINISLIDGGGSVKLKGRPKIPYYPWLRPSVRWAQNGSQIAYITTGGELYTSLPDGTGNVIVNENHSTVEEFKWSPYSPEIAYLASDDNIEISAQRISSIYTCSPHVSENKFVYWSSEVNDGVGNFEWAQ